MEYFVFGLAGVIVFLIFYVLLKSKKTLEEDIYDKSSEITFKKLKEYKDNKLCFFNFNNSDEFNNKGSRSIKIENDIIFMYDKQFSIKDIKNLDYRSVWPKNGSIKTIARFTMPSGPQEVAIYDPDIQVFIAIAFVYFVRFVRANEYDLTKNEINKMMRDEIAKYEEQ